jgi:hypothetical protein
MSTIIKNAQLEIANAGVIELAELQSNEGLKGLFVQRQELLKRRNIDTLAALNAVNEKYEAELNDVDAMYAMLLHMMTNRTDDETE